MKKLLIIVFVLFFSGIYAQTHTDSSLAVPQVYIKPVEVWGLTEKDMTDKVTLDLKSIKKFPDITGEPDLIKNLSLLPGITAGSEGTNRIFVRGSDSYQNLYLIDEVAFYNISHIYNFSSVINPDLINKIEIIKGGFPAYYDARIASIIKIDIINPANIRDTANLSLGILNFNYNFSKKLNKNAGLAGGIRISSIDKLISTGLYLYSRISKKNKVPYFKAGFGDIFLKYSLNLKKDLTIQTGFIHTFDRFKIGNEYFTNDTIGYLKDYDFNFWSNYALYLNLYKSKRKFDCKFSAYWLRYNFNFGNYFQEADKTNIINNQIISGFNITDLSAKGIFKYKVSKKFSSAFNVNFIHHFFDIDFYNIIKINPLELQIALTNFYKGKYFNFLFAYKLKKFYVSDTLLNANDFNFSFFKRIKDNLKVKFTVDKVSQFYYGLYNNQLGLPNEFLLPVTPQSGFPYAWQYSTTFISGKKNNISVGVFYKKLHNLIDFQNLSYDETQIFGRKLALHGTGKAYGIETSLFYEQKNFYVSASYTIAYAFRNFNTINHGRTFHFKFDRRHNFNLIFVYKINNKINFSLKWIYLSGYYITVPTGRFWLNGEMQFVYTDRNNFKIPDYHRLDISFEFKSRKKSVLIGVYNLYNRVNAYYLDYSEKFQQCAYPCMPDMVVTKVGGIPIMPLFFVKFLF